MDCKGASTLPPQPAYAELLPEPQWDHEGAAMITADGKYQVYDRISDNRWEIYDLEADPLEKKNVAGEPEAEKLKAQLATWMDVQSSKKPKKSP
jgi:hypothetical protein